jgi:hypothetical protein
LVLPCLCSWFWGGAAKRPPFPHCIGADFKNGFIDVSKINGALLLQFDERFLCANLFPAMGA